MSTVTENAVLDAVNDTPEGFDPEVVRKGWTVERLAVALRNAALAQWSAIFGAFAHAKAGTSFVRIGEILTEARTEARIAHREARKAADAAAEAAEASPKDAALAKAAEDAKRHAANLMPHAGADVVQDVLGKGRGAWGQRESACKIVESLGFDLSTPSVLDDATAVAVLSEFTYRALYDSRDVANVAIAKGASRDDVLDAIREHRRANADTRSKAVATALDEAVKLAKRREKAAKAAVTQLPASASDADREAAEAAVQAAKADVEKATTAVESNRKARERAERAVSLNEAAWDAASAAMDAYHAKADAKARMTIVPFLTAIANVMHSLMTDAEHGERVVALVAAEAAKMTSDGEAKDAPKATPKARRRVSK